VRGDAAAAAKALSDTQRTTDVLAFKGGLMDGQAVSADDIRAIAKLPSREVLYAQLVGTVAAPLNGLARTLNALISGIAVQLGQIRDQGLVGGTAAPAPAEEAPAEEAPAEEAPAAEADAPDTDNTENQTDAAAEAADASDAKED
jgi:large subunit ribosomal protein L10